MKGWEKNRRFFLTTSKGGATAPIAPPFGYGPRTPELNKSAHGHNKIALATSAPDKLTMYDNIMQTLVLNFILSVLNEGNQKKISLLLPAIYLMHMCILKTYIFSVGNHNHVHKPLQ